MEDTRYSEKEINWAIKELKKKHPENANREQAIEFLDTLKSLGHIVIDKMEKDKKSGVLKSLKPKRLN